MSFNDASLWTQIGSVVISADGTSFEAVGNANGDCPGLVTVNPYDLQTASIKVNVANDNLAQQALNICQQKVTAGDPTDNPAILGYALMKSNFYKLMRILRNTGNGWQYIHDSPWSGPSSSIRIDIHNGQIDFYENDILLYSEPMAIVATALYIYLQGYAGTNYVGSDTFSNFSLGGIPILPPSIDVTPKSASLQVGQSQMFSAVVSGGQSPYNISWIDNATQTEIGTGDTYTFNAVAEGVYEIYASVADSLGTIANSTIIQITVTALPPPVIMHKLAIDMIQDSSPITGIPIQIEKVT